MSEIWKPIPDFDYEVSNLGQVRSTKTGRVLKPLPTSKGYLRVALSKNNRRVFVPIHRLVAIQFIPNPSVREQVNHKDGNRQNNEAGNLEWVTCQENIKHKYDALGYKNPRRKLSETQVAEILASDKPQRYLAELFGVSQSAIAHIKAHLTYREVTA